MKIIIVKCCAISFLLLIWYLATLNSTGLQKLTSPSPTAALLVLRANGAAIAWYTLNTTLRVFSGYFIGAVVGVVTALTMLYSPHIGAVLDSYIELIRPVPPIALTPFFLFWFGVGNTGQIVLIAMVSFLVFTIALYESGSNFDVKYIRAGRSLGARRKDILLRIILPGSMVQIGAAARVAAAGAISVTVAAEYLGAQGGLGYLIRNARVTLETDAILVAVILLGLLSFVMDQIIRFVFARLTRWVPKDSNNEHVRSKRMRYKIASIVLLCMVVLTSSCRQERQQRSLQTVKFVVPPYQDSLVVTLGQAKGWYEEEGLNTQFTIIGLDEVQEALASGSVDVAWATTTNTMIASIKNPNLVYIYPWNTFDKGFALIARPGGTIKPVDDLAKSISNHDAAVHAAAAQLRGKTVITTSHTDMEQAVASAAERGGLVFGKDVEIINLPPDEGLAAFLAGTGDAYMGGIPQRTRAVKEGMIEVIKGLDLGPAPINGLVTSKAYLQNHEDVILKILKVWFRTVSYTNAHTDEVGHYIAAELNRRTGANFDVADFRRAWNGLEHFVDSPSYAQQDVFDVKGGNYWRRRWDDDNKYFYLIIKSIPHQVSPDGIFVADTMQAKFIERYGNGPF